VKILVPNIGSTSLKWRLFDFADGQGRVLHRGGLEGVTIRAPQNRGTSKPQNLGTPELRNPGTGSLIERDHV
jgi:acetate kinase